MLKRISPSRRWWQATSHFTKARSQTRTSTGLPSLSFHLLACGTTTSVIFCCPFVRVPRLLTTRHPPPRVPRKTSRACEVERYSLGGHLGRGIVADALSPRHHGFVFAPTGWRAFASTLRKTICRSQRRRCDLQVTPLRLIMIAGNPKTKTGRRMTFLIASLCILILIILTILLLRDHRTPWTPSNEPTLHPSTFVQSSAIN